MRKASKLGLAVGVPVLVYLWGVAAFIPETMAIASHVRHGFSTEFHGLYVRSPLLHWISKDNQHMFFWSTQSRLRSQLWGSAESSIAFRPASAREVSDVCANLMTRTHLRYEGSYTIRTVNAAANCHELAGSGDMQVFCSIDPPGVMVSWTGSPNTIGEFRNIIAGIRLAPR